MLPRAFRRLTSVSQPAGKLAVYTSSRALGVSAVDVNPTDVTVQDCSYWTLPVRNPSFLRTKYGLLYAAARTCPPLHSALASLQLPMTSSDSFVSSLVALRQDSPNALYAAVDDFCSESISLEQALPQLHAVGVHNPSLAAAVFNLAGAHKGALAADQLKAAAADYLLMENSDRLTSFLLDVRESE